MRYTGFHRMMRMIHRETRQTWLVHLGNEIDVTAIDQLRERCKREGRTPPSYTAAVIKAIALAMREVSADYPEINAMIAGWGPFRRIHPFERVNAGVAIAREDGGVDGVHVGVLEDADRMSIDEMTRLLHDFSTKPIDSMPALRACDRLYRMPGIVQSLLTRLGRGVPSLRAQHRGTFSITTVGKFGVDWQLGLPGAGNAVQFGFGSVRERAIVRDGQIVAARTLNLSMCFDRLQMNGRPCALLMERAREILEAAEFGAAWQSAPSSARIEASPGDRTFPAAVTGLVGTPVRNGSA